MCGERGIGVLCVWVLQGFCVDGSYRGFVCMCMSLHGSYRVICVCMYNGAIKLK